VAEKIPQLVLAGLARAATQPGLQPLLAQRGTAGLFPATQMGKQAAQKSRDEGYLDETGAIQPEGLAYLIRERPPRQVLEDFVRAIEAREAQLHELATQVCTLLASHEAMREHLSSVLAAFDLPVVSPPLESLLLPAITQWTGPDDMPLPELYRQVASAQSIGRFHDALRNLVLRGQVRVQPWTGPLYAIPHPELALLIGHEIGYYVSLAGKE
jgi:hypothetical protein